MSVSFPGCRGQIRAAMTMTSGAPSFRQAISTAFARILPRFARAGPRRGPRLGSMNRSLVAKAALVGVLALVLMIPVAMIRGLVAERQSRRNDAVLGIAEGWGKQQ